MKPSTIRDTAVSCWSFDMGQRIAVLGAGPMGLAVAYQLVLNGYEPVLFEADDRIGGMTATFDFAGLEIERYYHFHCISDHAFLNVLDELNLSEKMHWVPTKMGYWYQNQLQPWGNPIALLKFKGLSFIAKFRYGLHAFLSTKRNDWKPLDKVDAVQWIKRWVGPEAYEVLWRRLFDYKFYEYTSNLSAAWIWSRIRRIGRSRYSLFKEKLGYLEGGSETLLQGMHADIENNGGEVRLQTPVTKVIIESGSVKGLETLNGVEYFDTVISTIPLPYIPKIMPDLPSEILAQFKSVKNIAVVCVIVAHVFCSWLEVAFSSGCLLLAFCRRYCCGIVVVLVVVIVVSVIVIVTDFVCLFVRFFVCLYVCSPASLGR
jgi:protoporphyrinogen oxidase